MKKYLNIDNALLLLIVIAGIILRFYNYSGLSFTYDEFSAFFRTRFDNLQDLIYYGVKTTDTHPAGIQVFMYYWVKWIGDSEVVVKLPFTVFGVLSIIVGYKIAAKWFNNTVGLITALFLAVLQFPITYSLYARPYVSGLFFSLAMVWFWTNVVFYSEKKHYINLIGFIIFGAISAYNHHFSLFLVGLVGLSGLFYIKKSNIKSYLIACLSIFILYIPHLSIFFIQLNKGGVESWLHKPRPDFILNYIQYILHFSFIMYIVVGLLFVLSFVFLSKKLKETNKFRILSFAWFFITFLTGYFYSVYVNSVLQYSVLIFTFPFLVLFVFSFYKNLKPALKTIIVFVFLVTAIYTLIYERQHYHISYPTLFKGIVIEADKVRNEFGKQNVTTVLDIPDRIRNYYFDELKIDGDEYYSQDSLVDFIQFRKLVEKQATEYFVLAQTVTSKLEYKLIVEEDYPFMIRKKNWYKGSLYVYSKTKPNDPAYSFADSIIFSSIDKFETFEEGWDDVELPYQLSSGIRYKTDKILKLDNHFEYSPEFSMRLDDIINSKTNEILISVDAYMPDNLASPNLICELKSNDKVILWRANKFSEFINVTQKRLSVHLVLRLPEVLLKNPNIEISAYIWNQDFDMVLIDDFRIEVREGNPIVYGLFNKIL
ncbi:MAG: hypothetical protein B6D61_00115 [Bacteroidetes bacterium 4484_249]|nr:MAG: hypothetical protein B6D61_00115 [Bacteroidetes bacterium 4484_249]